MFTTECLWMVVFSTARRRAVCMEWNPPSGGEPKRPRYSVGCTKSHNWSQSVKPRHHCRCVLRLSAYSLKQSVVLP